MTATVQRVPQRISITRDDGRRVAGLDWGGTGPDLLFLHPNGFGAGVFEPVAELLSDRFRCFGIDLCGHGRSDPPERVDDLTYSLLAADVVALLDALGIDAVRVVGHSLGGGVGIIVDRDAPGRIDRLLLCEAVVFPEPPSPSERQDPPLADITRRRRAVWPDRDTMRASYGSRPPLDRLEPAALDAYLRYGVVDREDGQVELACPPEVEAMIFEMTPTPRGSLPAWDHLPQLRGRAVVASGTETDLPASIFAAQAELVGGRHVVVSGTHFFPQEDSARMAELVTAHLG
jgi:pimeloyl-ACP methyl ester carboxylesterase